MAHSLNKLLAFWSETSVKIIHQPPGFKTVMWTDVHQILKPFPAGLESLIRFLIEMADLLL